MEKAICCDIITIGDELLIGQVIDTNSAWMAQKLNAIGILVRRIISVHDDASQIEQTIREAFDQTNLVFLTGGLGPTKDDITKLTLCHFFGTELVYYPSVRTHLETLYRDRPEILNRLTDTQMLLPRDCQIIPNKVGSAQVLLFERGQKRLFSLPGVPYEMEYVMNEEILPMLVKEKQMSILHRTILVYGIPESVLALQIAEWETNLPKNLHLAYLPQNGIVRLRLSGMGQKHDLERDMAERMAALKNIVGEAVIATEDLPVEVLLANRLKTLEKTIGSAESCTGGKIGVLLNKYAGSSIFYKGSIIAYSNEIKHNLLGVSQTDLEQYGAVSEPVVRQMADGARQVLKTDYAIATSGIAGPDGGTAEKPVGTVWVAIATPTQTYTECLHCGRLREQITDRATLAVLVKLLNIIK